jgi:hypothetical protein
MAIEARGKILLERWKDAKESWLERIKCLPAIFVPEVASLHLPSMQTTFFFLNTFLADNLGANSRPPLELA